MPNSSGPRLGGFKGPIIYAIRMERQDILKDVPGWFVLIRGASYRNLDFDGRERVREELRRRLEDHGIRFVQYDWVWDEEDWCLLVVGRYRHAADARVWAETLERLGFDVCWRRKLPGPSMEKA